MTNASRNVSLDAPLGLPHAVKEQEKAVIQSQSSSWACSNASDASDLFFHIPAQDPTHCHYIRSLQGTRHAEFEAIDYVLQQSQGSVDAAQFPR